VAQQEIQTRACRIGAPDSASLGVKDSSSKVLGFRPLGYLVFLWNDFGYFRAETTVTAGNSRPRFGLFENACRVVVDKTEGRAVGLGVFGLAIRGPTFVPDLFSARCPWEASL